jgi:glutamine amidotransferase-like uncharacterized protein
MTRLSVLLAVIFLATRLPAADPPSPTSVALFVDEGVTGKGPQKLETALKDAPDLRLVRVTAADIRAGRLKDFRVLIVPGGVGSTQALALGADGREAIRQFVKGGGCFVGICAGCYLASTGYDWSLDLLPAKVIDRAHWERGKGYLEVEFTPGGKEWFGRTDPVVACWYANGPVLQALPDTQEELVVLARYRQELVPAGAKPGVMRDSPAVVAARFGDGWAIGVGPHPEQTDGLEDLIPSAIRKALSDPPKK